MNSFHKKDLTSFSKKNITSQKNCWWNDIYRLAWKYWFNTEEIMGIRIIHMILGCKRISKPRRTLSGFLCLSWSYAGPNFNLHPCTEISSMVSLTPKSSICYYFFKDYLLIDFLFKKRLLWTKIN